MVFDFIKLDCGKMKNGTAALLCFVIMVSNWMSLAHDYGWERNGFKIDNHNHRPQAYLEAMFTHANIPHCASNMFVLWDSARVLHGRTDSKLWKSELSFASIYFGGAFAGMKFSQWVHEVCRDAHNSEMTARVVADNSRLKHDWYAENVPGYEVFARSYNQIPSTEESLRSAALAAFGDQNHMGASLGVFAIVAARMWVQFVETVHHDTRQQAGALQMGLIGIMIFQEFAPAVRLVSAAAQNDVLGSLLTSIDLYFSLFGHIAHCGGILWGWACAVLITAIVRANVRCARGQKLGSAPAPAPAARLPIRTLWTSIGGGAAGRNRESSALPTARAPARALVPPAPTFETSTENAVGSTPESSQSRSADDIASMSVQQLKVYLQECEVPVRGTIEKSDLVALAVAHSRISMLEIKIEPIKISVALIERRLEDGAPPPMHDELVQSKRALAQHHRMLELQSNKVDAIALNDLGDGEGRRALRSQRKQLVERIRKLDTRICKTSERVAQGIGSLSGGVTQSTSDTSVKRDRDKNGRQAAAGEADGVVEKRQRMAGAAEGRNAKRKCPDSGGQDSPSKKKPMTARDFD